MRRLRKLAAVSLALVLLCAASLSVSSAQGAAVYPPDATIQGHTYGDWAAVFFKSQFSLPVAEVPGFPGTNRCVIHKQGQVGILGFDPVPTAPLDCGTISRGTMLFVLAPVGIECSVVEPAPFHGDDAAGLAACANQFSWSGLSASLDGVAIPNVESYIVQSGMYRLHYPKDNVFGVPLPGSTWSVARGPFLMFAPMAPGLHTIHVVGTVYLPGVAGSDFPGDATLLVTVQ